MTRTEAISVVVVIGVASWVIATAFPGWSEVAWAGGVLVLLAVALVALTARATALRAARLTPFHQLLRTFEPPAARPEDLARIERLTGWVAYSQHDFNHRLRPVIVSLIRKRLEMSRGLSANEESLPLELLPERLAALVAPDAARTRPITTAELARALDDIEAL